ncbi:hypothetical protein DP939_36300 [Spongiactinospora rosea]|uniref:Uncharacterized protein n=1 Tax=Spongiactinospora rosea TaxID=2248750 RepID=A0A366LN22_9ACTN|nr:hypothetical protein [Spongiactinospora rosea]RBQ15306.1 hypothetical protein DP939_36300 [Spongiactinospora rosea]
MRATFRKILTSGAVAAALLLGVLVSPASPAFAINGVACPKDGGDFLYIGNGNGDQHCRANAGTVGMAAHGIYHVQSGDNNATIRYQHRLNSPVNSFYRTTT